MVNYNGDLSGSLFHAPPPRFQLVLSAAEQDAPGIAGKVLLPSPHNQRGPRLLSLNAASWVNLPDCKT